MWNSRTPYATLSSRSRKESESVPGEPRPDADHSTWYSLGRPKRNIPFLIPICNLVV